MKKKRDVIIGTVCTIIIASVAQGFYSTSRRMAGRPALFVWSTAEGAPVVSTHIFQETGFFVVNLSQIQRSDYYPFVCPFANVAGGKVAMVGTSLPGFEPSWFTSVEKDGDMYGTNSDYDVKHPITAEEVTKRRINTCLSGCENLVASQTEYRSTLLEVARLNRNIVIKATRNAVHRPDIRGNLPVNSAEVRRYTDWLAHAYGLADLRDAWGHLLRIAVVDRRLRCSSAGKDGRFGTDDDIRAAVDISAVSR